MMNYEEKMRRDMEQAAKEQQCPIEDNLDAAFGIKRMARKIGAKIGIVKHPSAQTIGDIKRSKVGDSDLSKPPRRKR